ncbi:hypothetical protein, partial [Phormidesmis priestleyi]
MSQRHFTGTEGSGTVKALLVYDGDEESGSRVAAYSVPFLPSPLLTQLPATGNPSSALSATAGTPLSGLGAT